MSIQDAAKHAGQALKTIGTHICGKTGVRFLTHFWLEPFVAGITQNLINNAINDTASYVGPYNPGHKLAHQTDVLAPIDIMTMTLASYHATGTEIIGKQGDLIVKAGNVGIWGKGEFTHENKADYSAQSKLLGDFWQNYTLIHSIEPDPEKMGKAKGLFAKQTFTALTVSDGNENIYVIVPGANKDAAPGFSNLKEGGDVLFGYTNDEREDFAKYLERVKKDTNAEPQIVTYSNASTHGYMAAAMGHKVWQYEAIGLRPANVLDLTKDIKSVYGVNMKAEDVVKNINANTVAIHCGAYSNLYGYAAKHLTRSFNYISGDKKISELIEAKKGTIGKPTNPAHQVAQMIIDVKSGTGRWLQISNSGNWFKTAFKQQKLNSFEIA